MEPLGKGPLNIPGPRSQTPFLSVGNKVAAGRCLIFFLMREQYLEQSEGHLQEVVANTFLVEIFDKNRKNGFDYFAVDGIVYNEGLKQLCEIGNIGWLYLDGIDEEDDRLEDGMIEFYNLLVSFEENEGIELIGFVDVANPFDCTELNNAIILLCLNLIQVPVV